MELKDFVSGTMEQIIEGIIDAQQYAEGVNARINPVGRLHYQGKKDIILDDDAITGQILEFDVAVTTTEGDQYKGGLGIFVGPVGVGTQGQADFQNSTVSRIKFSVPIFFPLQGDPETEKKIKNRESDPLHEASKFKKY